MSHSSFEQNFAENEEVQTNFEDYDAQFASNNPPDLNGSNATLLDQYYSNVIYHIEHIHPSQLSPVRNELCKKIKHKLIFQSKVFGKSSTNFDNLPENLFSTFTVGLYLILKDKTFTFYSSNPGFEITDSYEETGNYILEFISRGILPPRMLDDVRKLNLVWYDGGLICEIDDQRKKNAKVYRTLLKVNQSDIASLGLEIESEYLLARYPLLSFSPDIQVSKVARVAERDLLRWKQESTAESSKQYVQEHYPSIFLTPKKEKKEDIPPEDPKEATKMIFDQLAKITQK